MRVTFAFSLLLVAALCGVASSGAQTIDPSRHSLPAPRSAMTSAAATLPLSPSTVRNRERVRRTHQRTIPLDIVTYNVHLLPDIAARIAGERSQSAYRAGAIAERLAHYDIVGICEAFDPNYSRTLLDGLQAKSAHAFHVAKGPQRSGRAFTHSGLVLLSRYEILETHTIPYRNASRFVTHGFRADGFAAKGALHCRLRLGDQPHAEVDCFLTHMESRSAKARRLQIEQFADFVAEHSSPERPVVVLGDFNVAADSADDAVQRNGNSPYRQLRKQLVHNGRQLVDVWSQLEVTHGGTSDALAQDGGRRIDYIFVSAPRPGDAHRLLPQDVTALPLTDNHVREGSLSDHAAVACRAEFFAAEPAWR